MGNRRDSNPRRPGPQPGALPTELRLPSDYLIFTALRAVVNMRGAKSLRSLLLHFAVRQSCECQAIFFAQAGWHHRSPLRRPSLTFCRSDDGRLVVQAWVKYPRGAKNCAKAIQVAFRVHKAPSDSSSATQKVQDKSASVRDLWPASTTATVATIFRQTFRSAMRSMPPISDPMSSEEESQRPRVWIESSLGPDFLC